MSAVRSAARGRDRRRGARQTSLPPPQPEARKPQLSSAPWRLLLRGPLGGGPSSSWPGLFQSFFLSFHELQATSLSDLKFRGIDNYKEAFFIDARFLPRLKDTLTQNLLDVPVIMIFSLFSAILANQKIKGVIGFGPSSSCPW